MTYMISNSTGDGRFQIDVTFDFGANLDFAQVQVQNRVANRPAPHTCGRAHDWRHHHQKLARPDDGGTSLFFRSIA